MSRLELCADDKASDFENAESEAPICMTEEDMAQNSPARAPEIAVRAVLAPLALAQFICSFAGSNMNVMINDISADLDTMVQGVQIAITIFLLVMAALMIPCGKLTDRFGRKRCFTVGLILYGIGALLSAISPPISAHSSSATPSWKVSAPRCSSRRFTY